MASRSAHYTRQQIEILLDYLEANPQLIKGKLLAKDNQKLAAWEVVTQKINAVCPGTVKTAEQVKNKWVDLKYRVRLKVSKLAYKNIENKEQPSTDDKLTPIDRRILSLISKTDRTLINRHFDSTAITIKLFPANTLHSFVAENTEETLSTIATENNALQETPNYSYIGNVVAENLDGIVTDETNASNQTSNSDWSNQIIIQEIQSESQEGNASDTENATGEETSDSNWPFLPSRQSYVHNVIRSRKDRKKRLMEAEEQEFERKAIKTQERMANDINEIKLSMIQMKDHMQKYMERIDQKFDRMLDLLAVALNVEPEELSK